MANYTLLIFCLLLLFSVFQTVSGSPTLTFTPPLTLPAAIPPPQSSKVMFELCQVCRDAIQFCQCWNVNTASRQQPVQDTGEQYYEAASSSTAYTVSNAYERQYEQHHSQMPSSSPYYQDPSWGSASYYRNPVLDSEELTPLWRDTTYNPPDRTSGRLGPHYEQSREAALLDPVVRFLSSSAIPSGPNPLDNPSLLDSATINPQELGLPTDDHEEEEEHLESVDCPNCGKTFEGPHAAKNVQRHIHRQHNPQIVRHSCPFPSCTYNSIKQKDVERHVHSVHTGKQDFLCDVCPKKFNRVDNRNRHVRTKHPDYYYAVSP